MGTPPEAHIEDMLTAALLLWSLSVLVLSVALVLVVAVQAGWRQLRRLVRGRHAMTRSRSTRPGPRRGPGLVVQPQSQS